MKKNSSGLSRRQWIGISFFGGAGLASALVLPPFFEDRPDEIIRKILEYRLAPAKVPDDAYTAFLKVFEQSEDYTGFIKAYKIFSSVAPFYSTGLLHKFSKFKHKIKKIEELVFTEFTLSTNYFQDKAVQQGEKPIVYILDRSKRPCGNPFATFDTV